MSDDNSQVDTVEPGEQTEEMEPVAPTERFRFPVLEVLLTIAMVCSSMFVGVNIGKKIHTAGHASHGIDLFQAIGTKAALETNVTYQVISANGLGQTTAIDSGGEIALSKGQGLVIQVKNPIKDCRIGFCVFPRDALLIQEAENGKFGLVVEDEFEEDCLGIDVIFDASMKIVEGAVIFRIKPTQKSSEAESSI